MSGAVCPKCRGKFKEFELKDAGVIIDVCQLCRAIWFDKEEFWSVLKNKTAKKQFQKQGLLRKRNSRYLCPKCRSPDIFLEQGTLPMTEMEVEHCSFCKSFLFDDKEYLQAKTQMDENAVRLKSTLNENNLRTVQYNDFSTRLFSKRLKDLNSEVYEFTNTMEKPDKAESVADFFSRINKASALIFKEPEIILFSFFQFLAICIAYLLWIQILNWIPPEVWESSANSDSASAADYILTAWGVICVGFAALPIGFFTACIGAVHLLNQQGKESTISRCYKFVFPKIWPLWIFSWLDAWITVSRIIERLPNKDQSSAIEQAFAEAMYYAWKVGTAGVIPAILTTNNTLQASKSSLGFLKSKASDILKIRVGYSVINWVVGILTYVSSCFILANSGIIREEIYSSMYGILLLLGIPIFIAVGLLKIFVRPLYILFLFDLYSDYMLEKRQVVTIPSKNTDAKTALWFFAFLIFLMLAVILFHEEMGITKMLTYS